jgi:hypothetical protein
MTEPSSPRCPRCEASNPIGQGFCGTCGVELGAEPAPSPSRPPPAQPPFDLLRARNTYAVVIATVVIFLAVTAAGWLSRSSGSPPVAPTSPPAASTPVATAMLTPSAQLAATTPTPSPTPLAPATPTPSATSSPTPTIRQLAAAYLEAATAVNTANGAAFATWRKSRQTLADAKRLARACAAAELAFIRAVQKIPWFGDSRTLSRRVLTHANQRYVSDRSAMISRRWVDYNVNWNEAETANKEGSVASNELRIALGLPPVPHLGR